MSDPVQLKESVHFYCHNFQYYQVGFLYPGVVLMEYPALLSDASHLYQ